MQRAWMVGLLGLAACGGSSTPPAEPDAEAPVIGEDTTVAALDGVHVYFGAENRRQVDTAVTFPAPGLRYESVTLSLTLGCPTGGCDWWDRLGHLAIVTEGADTPEPEDDVTIEVARFMTPYRVGDTYELDVTPLQRLLEGEVTMRVFIDTWVGPGHANGAGWLVDATFAFVGGAPTSEPFQVIKLWGPSSVVYGDPTRATARTVDVEIPDGVGRAELYSLISGHGQGNAGNCAEFCQKTHSYTVGEQVVDKLVWRDDCATTATPGQQGTWMYPRAGWCPGATVTPWQAELTAIAPGTTSVTYDVEAYENTCRPDSASCSGCTLGTGCEYDGGAHTEPRYEQSALLVLYR